MLREVLLRDWYTGIIVISLTLIVAAKLLKPNRFIDFMKLIGNSNYLRIYFKDHQFFDPFDIVLFLNFCVNASLTAVLCYTYYGVDTSINFDGYLKLSLVLGLGILLKILIELAIGSLFELENLFHSYVFQQISTINFLGVILLPLNAFLIFGFPNQVPLLAVTLFFSVIIILIGFFKSIKSHQNLLINNLFYFILYLCTLEIGPYLILYKLVSNEKI
mgnify:CR=1 FL=1|tara:strand:+ start:15624 stop:16277 length:654 start_codon:yes stop_codon:yes gene_type:complete